MFAGLRVAMFAWACVVMRNVSCVLYCVTCLCFEERTRFTQNAEKPNMEDLNATNAFEGEIKEELKPDQQIDSTHASMFLENLYKIYKEKKLCDVSLVVGGKEVEAHRVVLAANSAYFYTMFTGDLLESSSREVVLKEVDFEAVKLLVDYCYTAVIDFNTSNAESLLKTAHLLQFNNIVKGCCVFMSSQLHPANCLGISSFAELHGCTTLRDTALTFATKHFCQVAKTDEFYLATLDQICQLLSSDSLNAPSEKGAFDIAMSWVRHDMESRKNFLPQILTHIRLELLPSKVLGNGISLSYSFRACSLVHMSRLPVKQCEQFSQTAKYYFCAGNFSVINDCCMETKAECLRMVENLESLDCRK